MKIAIVIDTMIYGGIERVAVSYVQLLKEMGHEVDAYVLNKNTEAIVDELKALCNTKIIDFKREYCADRYWVLLCKFGWGKVVFPFVYGLLKIVQPIFKLIYGNKKRYDVAIAFSGHMNDLTYVADGFVKAKKKIAWLHGAQYGYRLLSWGFYNLYKRIKHLVCLSDMADVECASFNEQYGIKKYKLYNPIHITKKSIDVKKVEDLKAKYEDFCVMVGRLAPDKDQRTAILAIEHLNKKYNLNKKLVLVGDGVKREELEMFVKERGLEDVVFFEGNRSDVENYYSAATVFVHSSPLEGLPTVLLEAMSFDLPIAATDSIPGVREILQNSQYGLISPVADAEGLAENIYTIYSDEKVRAELVMKARKRLNDFEPENIKQQLQEMLNEVSTS